MSRAAHPPLDADDLARRLRVTLGARLSDAGIPLVQAQRILRHSTPERTANLYTKPASTDLRAALDKAESPGRGRTVHVEPVTSGPQESLPVADGRGEVAEPELAQECEDSPLAPLFDAL